MGAKIARVGVRQKKLKKRKKKFTCQRKEPQETNQVGGLYGGKMPVNDMGGLSQKRSFAVSTIGDNGKKQRGSLQRELSVFSRHGSALLKNKRKKSGKRETVNRSR